MSTIFGFISLVCSIWFVIQSLQSTDPVISTIYQVIWAMFLIGAWILLSAKENK